MKQQSISEYMNDDSADPYGAYNEIMGWKIEAEEKFKTKFNAPFLPKK